MSNSLEVLPEFNDSENETETGPRGFGGRRNSLICRRGSLKSVVEEFEDEKAVCE